MPEIFEVDVHKLLKLQEFTLLTLKIFGVNTHELVNSKGV